MKRRSYVVLAMVIVLQLLLSGIVTVSAEDEQTPYSEPESTTVTYNMNLDWKFYDTNDGKTAIMDLVNNTVDADGNKFYEMDFDDSSWETVSIPHGIGGGTNSFTSNVTDAGAGYRSVLMYRKTFTVPTVPENGKVIFELEGIRQAAYVWCNGEKVGYYEAGITAMGFDLSSYVKSGEQAVIAILNDGQTARGNTTRIPSETVPGEEWGSSYILDNYGSYVGNGVTYQWNTKDFNEPLIGLEYDANLYVSGNVYQTRPLYNNLKTTGNYIYADNFSNVRNGATGDADITVEAEVRNESGVSGAYTVQVDVVDNEGYLAYTGESALTEVAAATDKGIKWETAVEADVYSDDNIANPVGITDVETPDVTYINTTISAEGINLWSTDNPYLYTVYTILKDSSGNVVDVQKKETGFREITFTNDDGIMINGKTCWMPGYAQRSTNEWAVIGVATDWLQDYDMQLLKENNSNFIRWMHVAPKPLEVRSADRYGVALVCPAGDKEGSADGRQWSQRVEAMRDAMIYFRNNPSIIFWETGNSAVGSAAKANEMADMRDKVDPKGMRFIGARSTQAADQLNYEYNYAGTMYGNYASNAKSSMSENGIQGPIMETEYARNEAPRRVWDIYSPPDYDYVNMYLVNGSSKKQDGYDCWNETMEDNAINVIGEYNGYYSNRNGYGSSTYSAAAMMIWSDSFMHTRNTATENCRTSGRVDPVRQTKESYYATQAAQSSDAAVHIIGHWSYPEVSDDTYNYYQTTTANNGTQDYYVYTDTVLKRDPTRKTVYVIGSASVSYVELYRIDGEEESLLGTDETATNNFIYQFDNIDVTQGDAVIAKAYDARGTQIASHQIERTYDAASLRLTAHTAVSTDEDGNVVSDWRADGSDIAYIDVEVIDENGNRCALNYDRINFTYTGEGVYLGGYNSGNGANCFQNTASSAGKSFYFGSDKTGTSTIGKDYVYAENGTNRIFVRSTRTAGSFTLTASMDGIAPISTTITSRAVAEEGGLLLEEQSHLTPGVSAVIPTTVTAMKPLQLEKGLISWSNVKVVTGSEDETEYYDVYIDGTKLEEGSPTHVGIQNVLFGPVYPILLACQAAGADGFEISYDDSGDLAEFVLTVGDHTYQYQQNRNSVLIDGTTLTECVDMPVVEDGVMIANIELMLDYAGISYSKDADNKIISISINN